MNGHINARTVKAGLSIDTQLCTMVEEEILPGLNLSSDKIWESLGSLLNEFQSRNQALLAKREEFQTILDQWHTNNPSPDAAEYKAMLQDIGYLTSA